ncbi:Mitochondrial basic amino acids transporter [Paramyrothecium foliicola]|nr:Mitochondrial basic amino acids transporter [Paramyrothecium foliicola]
MWAALQPSECPLLLGAAHHAANADENPEHLLGFPSSKPPASSPVKIGLMSADFWAGYISGAIGIIIGNPLDLIKVRLQADSSTAVSASARASVQSTAALVTGTAAPILGYGGLNALLFVSYNRSEAALNRALAVDKSLWTTWLAGAVGGLATWPISTPTELVKCRAQTSRQGESSWAIVRQIWQASGLRGLYHGGTVTALRDAIGYAFYFWSYELAMSHFPQRAGEDFSLRHEASKVLFCGGIAGVVTWASVFPLDVIKTRLQTLHGPLSAPGSTQGLLGARPAGTWQVTKDAYREGGLRVFFRGLGVCSLRAFLVNGVQWGAYEWIMYELGHGRNRANAGSIEGLRSEMPS